MRSLSRSGMAAALCCDAFASPAAADLRVENGGQPGMTSSVPQPAIAVAPRGACADVYDAPEANGEGGTCAAGSWPGPGGDWGPALEVAGGDRLLLHSAQPLTSLELAATTNFAPGLTTPDGTPVRNETLAGPVHAEATGSERTTFAVTLPGLDRRATNGLAFAIVTGAPDGTRRHYALSMRTPRHERYGESCGTVFHGPGDQAQDCPGAAKGPPPPGPGAEPPARPVALPTVASTARRAGRDLLVRVRGDDAGPVRASWNGLRSRWTPAEAGRWQVVRLRVGARRLPGRLTIRLAQRTALGIVRAERRVRVVGEGSRPRRRSGVRDPTP